MPKSANRQEPQALLRSRIRDVPNYPKKGILFRDITPLLKDSVAFKVAIDWLAQSVAGLDFDYIAGIEARGFIVGSALSYSMSKGFVPIRKKGKLPYKKVSRTYSLEYGTETMEMHEDAVERGSKVLIVDDLLATGGTAKASADLISQIGAKTAGYAFLLELTALGGRKKLEGGKVTSLIKY